MLTQQRLAPPLTSPVQLSLFTHAHSSPLSLAARLHWYCTTRSHYINNGCTFSWQTLYTQHFLVYTHILLKHTQIIFHDRSHVGPQNKSSPIYQAHFLDKFLPHFFYHNCIKLGIDNRAETGKCTNAWQLNIFLNNQRVKKGSKIKIKNIFTKRKWKHN